jgi:hypothetical protein
MSFCLLRLKRCDDVEQPREDEAAKKHARALESDGSAEIVGSRFGVTQ